MAIRRIPTISTPHFADPTYPNYRSPITVKWNNTLAGANDHSFYIVEFNTSPNFPPESAVTRSARLWDNNPPNELESPGLAEGGWHVRVNSHVITFDDDIDEGLITIDTTSDWSVSVGFTINNTTQENPAPDDYWLAENLNSFIPVVYGVFHRNMDDPTYSNGLALAYLASFSGDATYYAAAHPCDQYTTQTSSTNPEDRQAQLYIPTPGTPEVPLAVLSKYVISALARKGEITWKRDDGGRYVTQRIFLPSKKSPMNTPFADSKWLAENRDNVIDDDNTTVAITKVPTKLDSPEGDSEKIDLGSFGINLIYWQVSGGSAWEIADTEQVLGGLLRPESFTEIFVKYRNLHVYPEYLPLDLTGPMVPLLISFEMITSTNNDSPDEVVPRVIGQITEITEIENSRLDNEEYLVMGPLTPASAGSSYNRDFAFRIMCNLATATETIVGADLFSIADLKFLVNQIFSGDEQRNAFKAYAGIHGRIYGSWLSNFSSYGFGAQLYSQYNNARFNELAIEDPAMIVASLCIDYAGYLPANFDTTSFEDAITMLDNRMRVNITEDDVTVRDVIEEITQQVPFKFVVTPSGQVKLMNIRTVIKYIEESQIAARPLYGDMKAGTFKLKKTPLDKVVNVLPIKSRWQAEINRFVDFDEYKNNASIQKYREKRSKAPLEFKYVNSGPGPRDEFNNSTTRLLHNPVKWQAVHLIEPDEVNKRPDAYHLKDDGWISNQHSEISLELPGYEFMSLEIGDIIVLDNTSFAANNLTCFGESWAPKRFMIQSITKDQDGVKIRSAIQLPKYENFFALRGMSTWSQP